MLSYSTRGIVIFIIKLRQNAAAVHAAACAPRMPAEIMSTLNPNPNDTSTTDAGCMLKGKIKIKNMYMYGDKKCMNCILLNKNSCNNTRHINHIVYLTKSFIGQQCIYFVFIVNINNINILQ